MAERLLAERLADIKEGDRVRITYEGTVINVSLPGGVMSLTGFGRNRRYLSLTSADEVEILPPETKPGEAWLCLLQDFVAERAMLKQSNGFWADHQRCWPAHLVTPLRKLVPEGEK